MATARTQAELYAEIATLLASSQPGGITAQQHRTVESDIVASVMGNYLGLESFGAVGDGASPVADTAAAVAAMAAAPVGGRIYGQPGKIYNFTGVTITKPLTFDFNGAYVKPATTGNVFTLNQALPDSYPDIIALKNLNFIPGSSNPASLIKILHGTINPLLHRITAQGVLATHSYIWHAAGYGLTIDKCSFRNVDGSTSSSVPAVLYFSQSNSDPLVFSVCVHIRDTDISNISGVGVITEGGEILMTGGTIEGCTLGGFKHSSVAFGGKLALRSVHFEQNLLFDVSAAASTGASWIFDGCEFMSAAIVDHVLMGAASRIVAIGNQIYSGGFGGVAPTSYVGLGNDQRVPAAGYSGTFDAELSNAVRGAMKSSIVTPLFQMPSTLIASGGADANVVAARPLSGTAYEEWRIVGTFNLPTGFQFVARVFVSRQDTTIVGVVVVDSEQPEVMTLDQAPGGIGFNPGDLVTGNISGATARVVSKASTLIYGIKDRTGVFTLGEILSNGTNTADQGAAHPTTATASGIPRTLITVVDLTGSYNINIKNLGGSAAMTYFVTRTDNPRLLP